MPYQWKQRARRRAAGTMIAQRSGERVKLWAWHAREANRIAHLVRAERLSGAALCGAHTFGRWLPSHWDAAICPKCRAVALAKKPKMV